jgi:hypothetical protein
MTKEDIKMSNILFKKTVISILLLFSQSSVWVKPANCTEYIRVPLFVNEVEGIKERFNLMGELSQDVDVADVIRNGEYAKVVEVLAYIVTGWGNDKIQADIEVEKVIIACLNSDDLRLRENTVTFLNSPELKRLLKEYRYIIGVQHIKEFVNTPIVSLELSVRSFNILERLKIETVKDLLMYTEKALLDEKNLGKKSLTELKSILSIWDLTFVGDNRYTNTKFTEGLHNRIRTAERYGYLKEEFMDDVGLSQGLLEYVLNKSMIPSDIYDEVAIALDKLERRVTIANIDTHAFTGVVLL